MSKIVLARCLAVAFAVVMAGCAQPAAPVPAACKPVLEDPWVRAAPPGAQMHAGYAVLRNDCDSLLSVVGAESLDFASAAIHETVLEGGVSQMREAGALEVAPHGRLVLEPGGRHLMLMGPSRSLPEGARVRARLVLADGRRVFAEFEVRRDAPR